MADPLANLLPVGQNGLSKRNRFAVGGQENQLVFAVFLRQKALHADLRRGHSLLGVYRPVRIRAADASAGICLFHMSLELKPDRPFQVEQEPLCHRLGLVRLEPNGEVGLKLAFNSFEAQRDSHEVRPHALLTQVEKLVAVCHKCRRHRESVQGLERLSQADLVDELQLGAVLGR